MMKITRLVDGAIIGQGRRGEKAARIEFMGPGAAYCANISDKHLESCMRAGWPVGKTVRLTGTISATRIE